jgi:acylphosphatase
VETVAEGGREALNEFLAFLQRGSPSAVVEKVNIEWETPTGEFERFKVRYI